MNKSICGKPLLWILFIVVLSGISLDIYNKIISGGLLNAITTFKYFTLQSNLLVLIFVSATLFSNEKKGNSFVKGFFGPVTSYLLLTGIVYLIILEPIYELHGTERISSVILHYVTPPLMFIYWLMNEKRRYAFKEIFKWLAYPVLFMMWGLFLAIFFKDYLYPFFDISQYGADVALYLLLVAIGFVSMVVLFIFINNFYLTAYIPRRRS